MDGVMTAKELAEYLKVTEDHIRRLTHRGDIPYSKLGHTVRYRMSDIQMWLDSKRVYCKKEINEIAETYVATTSRKGKKVSRKKNTKNINNSTI